MMASLTFLKVHNMANVKVKLNHSIKCPMKNCGQVICFNTSDVIGYTFKCLCGNTLEIVSDEDEYFESLIYGTTQQREPDGIYDCKFLPGEKMDVNSDKPWFTRKVLTEVLVTEYNAFILSESETEILFLNPAKLGGEKVVIEFPTSLEGIDKSYIQKAVRLSTRHDLWCIDCHGCWDIEKVANKYIIVSDNGNDGTNTVNFNEKEMESMTPGFSEEDTKEIKALRLGESWENKSDDELCQTVVRIK